SAFRALKQGPGQRRRQRPCLALARLSGKCLEDRTGPVANDTHRNAPFAIFPAKYVLVIAHNLKLVWTVTLAQRNCRIGSAACPFLEAVDHRVGDMMLASSG